MCRLQSAQDGQAVTQCCGTMLGKLVLLVLVHERQLAYNTTHLRTIVRLVDLLKPLRQFPCKLA